MAFLAVPEIVTTALEMGTTGEEALNGIKSLGNNDNIVNKATGIIKHLTNFKDAFTSGNMGSAYNHIVSAHGEYNNMIEKHPEVKEQVKSVNDLGKHIVNMVNYTRPTVAAEGPENPPNPSAVEVEQPGGYKKRKRNKRKTKTNKRKTNKRKTNKRKRKIKTKRITKRITKRKSRK
jgi:hypothetical protein